MPRIHNEPCHFGGCSSSRSRGQVLDHRLHLAAHRRGAFSMATRTETVGNGLRHRTANGNGKTVTPSEQGKQTDKLLDAHVE